MKFTVKSIASFIACFLCSLPSLAQYSSPESAVRDPVGSRWIISNAGNGRILQFPDGGAVANFATNLDSPKGLCIIGDTLYVADVTRIRGYRLTTREALFTLNVPNSSFLNDAAADDRYLYVSEMARHRIYRMRLSSREVEAYVSQGITNPNGLFFDRENNRLIVVSYRANSPVQQIDLRDGAVSTIINTQLTELDGIARDGNGNYYISSWGSGSVYRFRSDFSNQTQIAEGFDGPADIFYDTGGNILAIPVMGAHRLVLRDTPPPEAELRVPFLVDFEGVSVFTDYTSEVVWSNSGGANLRIDSLTHTGEGFDVLFDDDLMLRPGDAAQVSLTFSPVDTVVYTDTVAVYSNEPRSPRRMILTGRGVPAADLAAPATIDLGRVWIGREAEREVVLRNRGFLPLTLDSARTRRGGGFDFRMPRERRIAAGEQTTGVVNFTPFARQEAADTLLIYSSDPTSPARIILTAVGAAPPALRTAESHDFGETPLNGEAVWRSDWLNGGDDTLWIEEMRFGGSLFSVEIPDSAIAPGGTIEAAIRFAPGGDAGLRLDTLRIQSNDPHSPARIALRGYAGENAAKRPSTLPAEFSVSEVYPNPFNSTARLTISLPQSSDVELSLFDSQGRLARKIAGERREAGMHTFVIDGEGLAGGSYVVRGTAGGEKFTRTVITVK